MKDAFMTLPLSVMSKSYVVSKKTCLSLVKSLNLLIEENPLPNALYDHPLKGKRRGCRELHIEPDWLLIYHIDDNTIYFDRTGSHAQLF